MEISVVQQLHNAPHSSYVDKQVSITQRSSQ